MRASSNDRKRYGDYGETHGGGIASVMAFIVGGSLLSIAAKTGNIFAALPGMVAIIGALAHWHALFWNARSSRR